MKLELGYILVLGHLANTKVSRPDTRGLGGGVFHQFPGWAKLFFWTATEQGCYQCLDSLLCLFSGLTSKLERIEFVRPFTRDIDITGSQGGHTEYRTEAGSQGCF